MKAIVTENNVVSMHKAAAIELRRREQRADRKEKASGNLRDFVEQAWHVVEPSTPFVGGWNLDAVCDHLQGVTAGHIRNLVINVPPRTAKSLIVSVFWPAWAWISKPDLRWLFSSYTSKLSLRDSMKCRRVIDSKWYQDNWGGVYQLIGDQNTKENYENDKTGQRIATSVSGIGVGAGGDIIACLDGETMIATDRGQLPIQKIVDERLPVKVLSFNHRLGVAQWRPIEAYEQSPGRDSIQVSFSNGISIKPTLDHPVFIAGKGYVEAVKLECGNRALNTTKPILPSMRGQILPKSGARGSFEKRDSGVQHQVLRGVSAGAEEQPVQNREGGARLRVLRREILRKAFGHQEEERQVLFYGVPRDGYQGEEPSPVQSGTGPMRRMFEASAPARLQAWAQEFLRPPLRKLGSPEIYRGTAESALQGRPVRKEVLGRIFGNRSEDSGARREPVSAMRVNPRSTNAAVRRASYRLHDRAQRGIKFDHAMPVLPREGSRKPQESPEVAETTVCSIEPIPTPSRVFNIRVAVNHNYFANGILVHNCDDPNNTEEIESEVMRENVLDWWDHTMSTRGNNPKTVARVIVQQRLHEEDLSGHVLAQGGYTHLCLPMRFEINRRCTTTIGARTWADPRQKNGDLLWPERFGDKEIRELETRLGSYMAAGQLQQNPSPIGGGMLKSQWWKFWQPRNANLSAVQVPMPDGSFIQVKPIDLPEKFDMVVQSWDMAFKDLETSDYVVGQVHAARGASRFLLDQVRDQMDLPKTLLAVRRLSMMHPSAYLKLVEDKANGPAVIQSLHHEIGGFIAVNPIGGKISRAAAGSPEVEAGNWYLPHPLLAPWVEGFIAECAGFPKAAYDDQVDAWSQGSARLRHVKPVADEDSAMDLRIQTRNQGGWSA